MSPGCSWSIKLGFLNVDLRNFIDGVFEQFGSTALDTIPFTLWPTGIRDLPVMVWPIIQARCHLIGATLLATEYASFTNF